MGQVLPNLFGVPSRRLVGMSEPVTGSLPYASSATAFATLAPNTAASLKVLTQTGTGSAGQAPAWAAPVADLGLATTAYADAGDASVLSSVASSLTGYALLAGRAGGQTLIGDTASGGNLTLQSTSNGTKGRVLSDEMTVTATGTGVIPLVISLLNGQTANAIEVRRYTGTVAAKVAANGDIYLGSQPSSTGGQATLMFRDGSTKYAQIVSDDTTPLQFQTFGNSPITFQAVGGGGVTFGTAVTVNGTFTLAGNALDIGGGTSNGIQVGSSGSSTYKYVQAFGGQALLLNNQGNKVGVGNLSGTSAVVGQLHVAVFSSGTQPLVLQGVASQTGVMLQLQGKSSTTDGREQVDLDTAWATSTDASRKARFVGRVWDTAAREFLRAESNGSLALTSIGGSAVASDAVLFLQSQASGYTTLVVQRHSTDTDDLTHWRNASGSQVAAVNYQGQGTFLTVQGTAYVAVGSGESTAYIGPATATLGAGVAALKYTDGSGDNLLQFRAHSLLLATTASDTVSTYTRLGVKTAEATQLAAVLRGFASQSAVMLQIQGKSSTTEGREQLDIDTAWATSTDASRKARGIFRVWDTAAREAIRIEASGSEAMLGFYGVAATTRQLLATGAGATVDNVITALQTLGLVKQS